MTDSTSTSTDAVLDRVRFGADGLLPAIVQEETSKDVLMLGYMDREALRRTLTEGRVTQAELKRGLVAAGLPADRETVAGLRTEAEAHLTRRAIEEGLREELKALGRPIIELPSLAGGVDREGLTILADTLRQRSPGADTLG